MNKKLLSFVTALSMVLATPATLLAAESPEAHKDGWVPATAADMIEHGFITAAAPIEPTIVAENENEAVIFHDTSASFGTERVRTVTSEAGNSNRLLNVTTSAADSGQTAVITPVKVTTGSVTADRHSNTSGSVTAYASFNARASKASCTMTLQEKSGGSWKTATGVPVVTYKKTVTNSYSITAGKTFTLKAGKVYRVKAAIIDTTSSGTYTKTLYTGSF